ncbi:MAG: hypothetical protein GY699_16510 [Desulfobacteraceae bacterium]|nr:hypothetical protein [Desulfobacteraceae bacterium]
MYMMRYKISIYFLVFLFSLAGHLIADDTKAVGNTLSSPKISEKDDPSLKMLNSILELKKNLNQRISERKKSIKQSTSQTEKGSLKAELAKLDKQLNEATADFERIATGIDIGLFVEKKENHFNWQAELVSLLEPGIKEIKRLTVKARYKTKLKDELTYYESLVPISHAAAEHLSILISKTSDKDLKKNLESLLPEWKSVEKQIRNKMEIASMQLAEMENEKKSFFEISQISIKSFIRTRGLFLFIALIACVFVVVLLRFSFRAVIKKIPGYTSKYRPFHIRVFDLFSRIFVLFMTLFVLVLVFFVFEDWVLLSLTIIFFMGLGWAAKNMLPKFWQQSRLMLNIGAVREGERIIYKGVPWLVKNINVFTKLENPYMGITLRLPIEELFDRTSRSFHKSEPWFPCKRNDWVILSDETRGHVTSISHEMVELVQRGGAKKTYQTADFLALTPLNLSVNFRLKIPFGISYNIQKESTGKVLSIMESYINERIDEEGYVKSLLNLRVEFQNAGSSSLDIIVIADFKGDMAPLYKRLSRAIQRWCVDACTLNQWEIPFPQLTIHK